SGGTSTGSIAGAGSYILGAKQLTTSGNDDSTTVSGVISGIGGSLVKQGTGALTLSGTNLYTGSTTVNAGTLLVNGSIAVSSGTTVNAGATAGGTGTLSSTTVNGGTLSPGSSVGAIGTVAISGNLIMTAAASYLVDVSTGAADRGNA